LADPHASFSATEPPQELPSSVTLPDPVSIRDLASALHLKPYQVVGSLIRLKIFASLNAELDFNTASTVCSLYGVAATKVA
jgi:translation initiation factor IF-2